MLLQRFGIVKVNGCSIHAQFYSAISERPERFPAVFALQAGYFPRFHAALNATQLNALIAQARRGIQNLLHAPIGAAQR